MCLSINPQHTRDQVWVLLDIGTSGLSVTNYFEPAAYVLLSADIQAALLRLGH